MLDSEISKAVGKDFAQSRAVCLRGGCLPAIMVPIFEAKVPTLMIALIVVKEKFEVSCNIG